MFTEIECWSPGDMNDFDKLPVELQGMIETFSADISNEFNEIAEYYSNISVEGKCKK